MDEKGLNSMRAKLEAARLLPMRAQAELSMEVLKLRLNTVLPWAMEQSGIDFWLVMGKEYGEDPVMKSLFPWDVPHAHRISILAFYFDQQTKTVRRMVLGGQSPETERLYENVKHSDETVWECLKRLVVELKPQRIGINQSDNFGFCDGLTATLKAGLLDCLSLEDQGRIRPAEELSVRWLQRATDLEKSLMETLTEVTQDIVKLTFSSASIQVGKTTTTDLEWLMRDMINRLGFDFWFGPDIDLQRKGGASTRMFGQAIQPGDLLHCDVGIVGRFVQLNTDMQWLCYVRRPGEDHAPAGLVELLKKGNRFQDLVCLSFQTGRTGNEVFTAAVGAAKAEGIKPMLYTHPLGTFGHGAGPSMGRYDRQEPAPGCGERPLEDQTCYALELNIRDCVPEWDGQEVYAYLEEDIYFDGRVQFLHGHQTELIEI